MAIGEPTQNNTYYYVGANTGSTPPASVLTFSGGTTSGWNTAVFPDARSNYTISADQTIITNVGDRA